MSQLNCIAEQHRAGVAQSRCGHTSLEPVEADADVDCSLLVHSAGTCCRSVDVLHAHCAVALLRHKLSLDGTLCCGQELSVGEVAGLCRLLLWDVDVCQRRCDEELSYIQSRLSSGHDQLQTCSSSSGQDLPPSSSANERSSQQSDGADVNDQLSSRGILFSTLICPSFLSICILRTT